MKEDKKAYIYIVPETHKPEMYNFRSPQIALLSPAVTQKLLGLLTCLNIRLEDQCFFFLTVE